MRVIRMKLTETVYSLSMFSTRTLIRTIASHVPERRIRGQALVFLGTLLEDHGKRKINLL